MHSSNDRPMGSRSRLIILVLSLGLAPLAVAIGNPLKDPIASEIPSGFFTGSMQPPETPLVVELPEEPKARLRLWQRIGPDLMARARHPPPLIIRWAQPSRWARPSADRLRQQLRPAPPPATPTLPAAKIDQLRRYPLPENPLRVPLRLWIVPMVSQAGWATLKLRLSSAPMKPSAVLVDGLNTADPETARRLSELLGTRVYALPQSLPQTLKLRALPAEVAITVKALEVVEWPGHL